MAYVTNTEEIIIEKLKAGDFLVTSHAQIRMRERNVVVEDIINAASEVLSIKWQENHHSYLLEGEDLLGESLFIAADIDEGVVIVTVFYRGDNP